MSVTKDIPVFVTIAGFRCKVWYRGQPITCFGCGKTGHVNYACPNRGRPQSPASTPEDATSGRTVVEDGNTIIITIPALPALDLPPVTVEDQENVEDMAAKGQKRLRNRDDSDSGDEVEHKTVRDITGDRVPTTSASSADIPDTTVAVHLDPDTEPPEATASAVVIADTASLP